MHKHYDSHDVRMLLDDYLDSHHFQKTADYCIFRLEKYFEKVQSDHLKVCGQNGKAKGRGDESPQFWSIERYSKNRLAD